MNYLIIQYWKRITKFHTDCIFSIVTTDSVVIKNIITNLYDLNKEGSRYKEFVFNAFSNLYSYVLLQVNKYVHNIPEEIRVLWNKAESLQNELFTVFLSSLADAKYFDKGDRLSVICLHFAHMCCYYFTKRDDIIFYDDEVLTEERLTIPHPQLAEREFALVPLCEIMRTRRHPVTGQTVGEMLEALRQKQQQA